jgi:hypothetical protein
MTPRALFTAIGATAIAFAVVIGSASSGSVDNSVPDATVTSVESGNPTQARVFGWTLTPGESDGAGFRRALQSDTCSIAV